MSRWRAHARRLVLAAAWGGLLAGCAGSPNRAMVEARWTAPDGRTENVPFSYESKSVRYGWMFTTLGRGGEHYEGTYVRAVKAATGQLVAEIYQGWSQPEWETWERAPDGLWEATGKSLDQFADFYTGKVVAFLSGRTSGSMRCVLQLNEPLVGLLRGGSGTCQVSDGGRIDLDF
ncbi:MAG: hypothetical protein V3U03_00035 [Myxococcota bacterium]